MDRNEILNQVKREIEPQVLEGYFDQILINRVVDATLKAINYIGCCETLPTIKEMNLEQAIAKAKPNLDKIKDVDKHLKDIR